ncbi:MAG: radical SAM family heme chaperone HemW, partial [Synergistaceae bacterium]|nr:radical SAM family heme chaperone HemW [Synergistaceae bacterium]
YPLYPVPYTPVPNPCSLYVHVPFCERKCGYCSFYSVRKNYSNVSAWLEALENEAERYSVDGKILLSTLYVGGGTPTVLTLSEWESLMSIIRKDFDTSTLIEATSEANPNSLTSEHVSFLKDNNFTRISLGVQSMNDSELKILGRIHDSESAENAMNLVKSSGLTLSCDLIFGIPGQTLRTWDKSLRCVMEYANHISCYQLTLEPDAPMYERYGSDDLNNAGYKFYRYAQYMLPRCGFEQYEISNFARSGYECRHNLAYWNHSDVIALGPSAVSYVDGVRYSNPRTLEEYVSGVGGTKEELSVRESAVELAVLSLRTKRGILRADLLPEIEEVIMGMPSDLFVVTPERIALTPRGMRLGNSIWCELIGV